MNSDLAFIDDQSDFSGSYLESVRPQPGATLNYTPEANRNILVKPNVSRILMSGEEPKFDSPEKSPKPKAPQVRPPAPPDVNLSLKASNTLKLL